MNSISRYIVRELSGPFWFSLSVIMFILVTKFIVQYLGKIFGKGLPLSTIFEFIYLNTAWMLALAVPMSVLLASLMAFGRLSADNEITVLKSAGINLYRIIRPALAAAIVLTLIMIWFNDVVLPEYNHRARQLYSSISKKKPTLSLEEGLYSKENKFNILVQSIEKAPDEDTADSKQIFNPEYQTPGADKLRHITIFDFSTRDMQRTITADYGFLVFDPTREQLVFNLFNGEMHEVDNKEFTDYRRANFSRNVFYIPAGDHVFKRREDDYRGDREMTVAMMEEKIFELEEKIMHSMNRLDEERNKVILHPDTLESMLTSGTNTGQIGTGLSVRQAVNRSSKQIQGASRNINAAITQQKDYLRQISKYEVEINKKYSIPFACIVFVLVGASLGIMAKRGSLGVGFTFSIGFFIVYWACLIGGEELADRQLVNASLSMWFPNIIVGILGIYLTVKTVRETTFIQWQRLPRFLQVFVKGNE